MRGLIIKCVVLVAVMGAVAYAGNRLMEGSLGSLLELAAPAGPATVQATTDPQPQTGGQMEIVPPARSQTGASAETVSAIDRLREGTTRAEVDALLGRPTISREMAGGNSDATWLRGDDTINVSFRGGVVSAVLASRLSGLGTLKVASVPPPDRGGSRESSGAMHSSESGPVSSGANANAMLSQLLSHSGESSAGGKQGQGLDVNALLSQVLGGKSGNADLNKVLQSVGGGDNAKLMQMVQSMSGGSGNADMAKIMQMVQSASGGDNAKLMQMLQSAGAGSK